MRRFLYLFIWTIVIGGAIFLGMRYQLYLQVEHKMNFNLLPYFVFLTLFPIIIGMLLRLPRLITEIKENRPWDFDWLKMIVVGLPTLYIVTAPLYMQFEIINYLPFIHAILLRGEGLIMIAGIIFGYVVLDSLKSNVRSSYFF